MPESAAIRLPPKATATFFYKYSGLSTPEHLERLRVIVQEHEIYLPTLPQLNDPADGRPRLAPLSEDEMSSFLYTMFVQNNPQLSQAELEKMAREGWLPAHPIGSGVRKRWRFRISELVSHMRCRVESEASSVRALRRKAS
jgi:hypothetical protein